MSKYSLLFAILFLGAAATGNKYLAGLLIKKGADVNAKDNDGLTALMFGTQQGYEDIAELLINNGAKVNIQGKYCKTAFDYAKDEKMIKYLKSEGAKKDRR